MSHFYHKVYYLYASAAIKKSLYILKQELTVFQSQNNFPFPASMYLLKVNNSNTRARGKLCSKLKIKNTERCWDSSGIFNVNFEQVDVTG